MTESQIIQGCRKLDTRCQQELVNVYSGKLYTVARRYCGEGDLAKDALQEGLIRIFRNIGKFNEKGGKFKAWMKKIVANESLRLLSKELKIVTKDIDDITGPQLSPEIIDQLHEEELLRLIQSLPLGYRGVFNMHVIEGYSHAEIGAILGIETSSSRSKLTRAKKMLQQKISLVENLQICHKVN